MDFEHDFDLVAKHFKMSEGQKAWALYYARKDLWRASRCYRAIARSL